MKREIIMICSILILVIAGNVITQKFSNIFFKELEEDLNNLEESVLKSDDNTEELKQKIYNIQNKWNSKNDILAYYIEHDELEKVGNKLCRIYTEIEVNQLDNAVIEIEECNFVLEHIKNNESFKLVNIF